LSVNPGLLIKQPTMERYIQLFDEIYNRQSKKSRFNLFSEANKAAEKRKVAINNNQ